jgi:hypothetical protein
MGGRSSKKGRSGRESNPYSRICSPLPQHLSEATVARRKQRTTSVVVMPSSLEAARFLRRLEVARMVLTESAHPLNRTHSRIFD